MRTWYFFRDHVQVQSVYANLNPISFQSVSNTTPMCNLNRGNGRPDSNSVKPKKAMTKYYWILWTIICAIKFSIRTLQFHMTDKDKLTFFTDALTIIFCVCASVFFVQQRSYVLLAGATTLIRIEPTPE